MVRLVLIVLVSAACAAPPVCVPCPGREPTCGRDDFDAQITCINWQLDALGRTLTTINNGAH